MEGQLEIKAKSINYLFSDEYFSCPVCGELVEPDDICRKCNWQNTGPENIEPGPNTMTLSMAKKAWTTGNQVY